MPKVLANELQELEVNRLLTRTVNDTRPITVSYALAAHVQQVRPVLDALIASGLKHREVILR